MKRGAAFLLSMTTGFVFLSFEIVWVRFFSVATKSDPMVFGVLLGFYLLGLGLGAGIMRRYLVLDREGTLFVLYRTLTVAAIICYSVMPLVLLMLTRWFYAYKYGYGLVLAAALSFGGVLPLIVRLVVRDESRAGSGVALVYTANIIGSAAGAMVSGYLLLDLMPLRDVSALAACVLLCAAAVVALFHPNRKIKISSLQPVALAAIVIAATGILHRNMYEKLMYMPRSRLMPPFVKVIENRGGVIAVARNMAVYGNGVYDGFISTSLSPKINPEIDNAYLVFLFHPNPARILEIGLSSGSWAQVLVNGPGVRSVVSVEINPGYLELIGEHDEVKSLLTNPRFTPVVDDGRRWLTAHPDEKFDAIVMNTTFHWKSHATYLLSAEFMNILKKHLNPGGIVYLNTTMSMEAIRTAAVCFNYCVQNGIYIIASDDPFDVDRERFAKQLMGFTIDGRRVLDPEKKDDRDTCRRLASTPMIDNRDILLRRTRGRTLVTDDNMATEFSFLKKEMRHFKNRSR